MLLIDDLLRRLVDTEASDLHLRVGEPPVMRIHGNLTRLDMPVLTDTDLYDLVHPMMNPERQHRFETTMELDMSYAVPGLSRFRVNIFRQYPDGVHLQRGQRLRQLVVQLARSLVASTSPSRP